MDARLRSTWLTTTAVCSGVWAALIGLQGVASHADALRRGASSSLLGSLGVSALAYLPWIPFTVLLYQSLSGRRHRRLTVSSALKTFAFWWVVFYLPQVMYQVAISLALAGRSLAEFPSQVARWPLAYWFIDLTQLLAAIATVYAIVITRAAAQADVQRLDAVRSQLEPHFLFNALNAISALVRTGDSRRALSALQQLSTLLRFVLAASRRDWVTLEAELSFVREYVAMQTLRFGDRLRVVVTGDTPEVLAADCPSLLLQPLVENAIRHGVEGRDGDALITLHIDTDGTRLRIIVTNDRHDHGPGNPGLGVGLTTLRDRLALLYGDEARIRTHQTSTQFIAELSLPSRRHPDA